MEPTSHDIDVAHDSGFKAYMFGATPDDNPYDSINEFELYAAWISGYLDAYYKIGSKK